MDPQQQGMGSGVTATRHTIRLLASAAAEHVTIAGMSAFNAEQHILHALSKGTSK